MPAAGGGYTRQAMLDAALRMPSLAPPGGEDLALRALSCTLHEQSQGPAMTAAGAQISNFASSDSSFAAAAALCGAWWQEVSRLTGFPFARTEPCCTQKAGKGYLHSCVTAATEVGPERMIFTNVVLLSNHHRLCTVNQSCSLKWI